MSPVFLYTNLSSRNLHCNHHRKFQVSLIFRCLLILLRTFLLLYIYIYIIYIYIDSDDVSIESICLLFFYIQIFLPVTFIIIIT